jgi:hypothetical protein
MATLFLCVFIAEIRPYYLARLNTNRISLCGISTFDQQLNTGNTEQMMTTPHCLLISSYFSGLF